MALHQNQNRRDGKNMQASYFRGFLCIMSACYEVLNDVEDSYFKGVGINSIYN